MTQLTKANLIGLYFKAEQNATVLPSGNLQFKAVDRMAVCKLVEQMLPFKDFNSIHKLAVILAANCPKASKKDRHQWRLGKWMADYSSGKLRSDVKWEKASETPVPVAIKPVVAKVAATPVTKPPIEPIANQGFLMLKQNLLHSIKSVCKSAIKQNLSQAEITSLLTGGLKEANEEYKVEQNHMKFTAFLRQNNIDKNTALDILQTL